MRQRFRRQRHKGEWVTELPSRSAFAGCVGNTFRILASKDRAETVTLIEVKKEDIVVQPPEGE